MSKKKTYTVRDFARYYEGNMPASEMHALEKAALEDPFLADALEGYEFTSSAEADIHELKSRIAGKNISRKPATIFSISKNVWWRVAAIFILIGIAGYFFFKTNPDEHAMVATTSEATDTPAIALARENPESVLEMPVEPSSPRKNAETNISTEDKAKSKASKKTEAAAAGTEPKIAMAPTVADSPLFESKAADEIAHAPAIAMRRTMPQAKETLDSVKPEPEQRKMLLTGRKDTIYFQPYNMHIPASSQLQPAVGTDSLRSYILRYKKSMLDEELPAFGSVEAEFFINSQGNISKVTIEKSSCKQCEKAITQMIEAGPKWKGDTTQTGRIIIDFKTSAK